MGTLSGGPGVIRDGSLILYLDVGNTKSYPGSGTAWGNLNYTPSSGAALMYTASYASDNSISFNGNFDVVNCGGNGSTGIYNITSSITLEVWVKPTTLRNNSYVITKGWGDTYQIVSNSSNFQFTIYGPTVSVAHSATTTTTPIASKWHHITGTFDGSNVKVYTNGILEATTSYSGPIYSSTGFSLAVGNISHMITSTTYPNNGLIGNVSIAKVYSKALSDSEVLQNFNALRSRFNI